MIMQWRQIPRPHHLAHLHQCLADGSAATRDPPKSLSSDEALQYANIMKPSMFYGSRLADLDGSYRKRATGHLRNYSGKASALLESISW